MVFDRIADKRIREAMSEGKFDHLPRKGAIDLEEYFKLPAELRRLRQLVAAKAEKTAA